MKHFSGPNITDSLNAETSEYLPVYIQIFELRKGAKRLQCNSNFVNTNGGSRILIFQILTRETERGTQFEIII